MTQKSISTAIAVSEVNSDVSTIGVSTVVNHTLSKKVISAMFAVSLATTIIGATGFAPGYAHNAAHDTRHVMVFPCH